MTNEIHGEDPPIPFTNLQVERAAYLIARKKNLREQMDQAFATTPQSTDWFTLRLFRLIAHADTQNLERIREGFPTEVEVYEEFLNS